MGTEPQLQVSSTISEGMARMKPTKNLSTAETLADRPMQSSSSREKPAPTTPTRKMLYQASQCEVDARTPQKRAKYTCECGEIWAIWTECNAAEGMVLDAEASVVQSEMMRLYVIAPRGAEWPYHTSMGFRTDVDVSALDNESSHF